MEITDGHPALPHIRRAERLFAEGDAAGCDAAFAEAERHARQDARLWGELAVHHVARLAGLPDLPRAGARCAAYLDRSAAKPDGRGPRARLRVLRAEIFAARGLPSHAAREAVATRHELLAHGGTLSDEDDARLLRVQGVAAGEEGDAALAGLLLERARTLFAYLGRDGAAADCDRERDRLGVAAGDEEAARRVADTAPPAGYADEFVLGMAQKRLCRYEEAYHTMVRCALREDLPVEWRWPVLRETALLLRALGRNETVDDLSEQLAETAARAADRPKAEAEFARLLGPDAPSDGTFMGEVQHALRLLAPRAPGRERLDAAERILVAVRDRASAGHESALWHLAAGELELKLAQARGDARAEDAVVHLELALDHAERCKRVEVRVQALRLLGRAHYRSHRGGASGGTRRALECWNEARRLEEGVSALQQSDKVRREMSLTVADTTDEWIEAAVAEGEHLGEAHASATLLVAMEAARGASVLAEILPGTASVRALPRPGDPDGARAWAESVAVRLPHSRKRAQAVWLMHAAPRHVHHAVLTWHGCFRVSVPCPRPRLQRALDRFAGCWSDKDVLQQSLESDEFGRRLADVAGLVGVEDVLGRLPEELRRIAVVAGGMLAEVPLGAVTTGNGEPLGVRYALSDLPCLSALAPLRRRGLRARGFSRLVVSPRPEGTGPPARVHRRERVVDDGCTPTAAAEALRRPRRRLMLLDRHATPEVLRAALALRRHRLVRIYSHGRHHHADSGRSKLQLAPEGPRGAVLTDEMQQLDLSRCGTLVLGACELGMAQRIGADERAGFVRAAFVAGAASVVAARWVAPAHVASALLDRFESYARRHPRDVALRLAQRDLHSGAAGVAGPGTGTGQAPEPGARSADGRGQRPVHRVHPAYWACWTLYGDSGFQTGAGPLIRQLTGVLRQFITRRRHAGRD